MGRLLVLVMVLLSSCSYALGLLRYHDVRARGEGYTVAFDNRSFIIDGRRTLLLSGAVHYPRVQVEEWSEVFRQMYLDGLNAVQTYVYWNLHQSEMGGEYDFSGNKNWTLFVEKAAEAGLFVVLRIGPFVGSEWDYGAIPHWINDIPGMYVRSNNTQWELAMQQFFTDMADLARPLMSPSGGPIILAQVENEFRWKDPDYIDWCGRLVKEIAAGIPFLMCNGYSASNTINTFNGDDGSKYAEHHTRDYPGEPLVWTEDEGWFQEWDKEPLVGRDNRTPEDMAYVVMKWFARGGAHHNYYMWYGGNNFGRLAGSCITTMYSDGVNLHSDMLPHEPKKTHLSKLDDLLAAYSVSLLHSPSQVNNVTKVMVFNETVDKFIDSKYQFAYVYDAAGRGVAFIENSVNEIALVEFRGADFTLPGLSSSLVDLSTREPTEVYNSGKVHSSGLPTKRVYTQLSGKFPWRVWQENVTNLQGGFTADHTLEQLSVTRDLSDYLFYQTTFIGSVTGTVNLTVGSRIANSLLAFVDGQLQSIGGYCTHGEGDMNYTLTVGTQEGKQHQLTILSVSLGVNTRTEPGEFDLKGITGDVFLGGKNITGGSWLHRARLAGEIMNVFTVNGSKNVTWSADYVKYTGQPVVWYQHTFSSPTVKTGHSLLLDLRGMQRGYLYLNGVNLGRYWLTRVNGVYVQRYYYLPQSLLTGGDNLLVLAEEIGALAPETVQIVTSTFVVP
jgi:hypothetical protein